MVASSNHIRPIGRSASNSKRRLCPPGSLLPFLCILPLIVPRSASAFQSSRRTTSSRPPLVARRTIATTSVSANSEDPIPELFFASDDKVVVPREPSSEIADGAAASASTTTTTTTNDSDGFGESVPYVPPSQRSQPQSAPAAAAIEVDVDEVLKRNRVRNVAVALASFALALFNYGYQYAHPVTAVEILTAMERESAPLAAIGNNGKPTVVDFWAPWCENCRVAAPTLRAVEDEYGPDKVNFVSVNADDGRNWPLIQLFGVDAIPHLALLSGEGDVETALIGPMSRNVLRADIDALLNKKEGCEATRVAEEEVAARPVCHEDLPYKMFDAFGNRQDSRRINFVEQ